MSALPAVCGGFLLAVLWFDLMFDVQVLGQRSGDLPEAVLASIAGYYRRVTTEARPMSYAVAAAMLLALVGVGRQLLAGSVPAWSGVAALILCGAPTVLARSRVLPNAVRLGGRADSLAVQSALARAIYRDHLLCLASIAAFVALQLQR